MQFEFNSRMKLFVAIHWTIPVSETAGTRAEFILPSDWDWTAFLDWNPGAGFIETRSNYELVSFLEPIAAPQIDFDLGSRRREFSLACLREALYCSLNMYEADGFSLIAPASGVSFHSIVEVVTRPRSENGGLVLELKKHPRETVFSPGTHFLMRCRS